MSHSLIDAERGSPRRDPQVQGQIDEPILRIRRSRSRRTSRRRSRRRRATTTRRGADVRARPRQDRRPVRHGASAAPSWPRRARPAGRSRSSRPTGTPRRGSGSSRSAGRWGAASNRPGNEKSPAGCPAGLPFLTFECRRRPTLPHPDECSTIGAGGLSFRVRDGTGRSPSAKPPTTLSTYPPQPQEGRTHHPHTTPATQGPTRRTWLCAQGHTVDASNKQCCGQALGLLVPVDSTPHRASIPGLSTPSSLGGLNHARWWETSSWNELPA